MCGWEIAVQRASTAAESAIRKRNQSDTKRLSTDVRNAGSKKKSSTNRKTLRSIRSDLVVVRCQHCGHHDELDRKAIVERYGALIPLQNLRRRIGMGCALMNAEGVDRCQMTITAKFDTKEA